MKFKQVLLPFTLLTAILIFFSLGAKGPEPKVEKKIPPHSCCDNGKCCGTPGCCDKKGCNSLKCPVIAKKDKDPKKDQPKKKAKNKSDL